MNNQDQNDMLTPLNHIVMPLKVWRKMTPQEYAEQHMTFGTHVAVSQEIVKGCQEVWVFLGGFIEFQELNSGKFICCWCRDHAGLPPEEYTHPDIDYAGKCMDTGGSICKECASNANEYRRVYCRAEAIDFKTRKANDGSQHS